MHFKMSSTKWRPFCLGLNVLIVNSCTWVGLNDHLEWRQQLQSSHYDYLSVSVKYFSEFYSVIMKYVNFTIQLICLIFISTFFSFAVQICNGKSDTSYFSICTYERVTFNAWKSTENYVKPIFVTAIHWHVNVLIWITFSELVAPKVVKMTTFGESIDENCVQMTTFPSYKYKLHYIFHVSIITYERWIP